MLRYLDGLPWGINYYNMHKHIVFLEIKASTNKVYYLLLTTKGEIPVH